MSETTQTMRWGVRSLEIEAPSSEVGVLYAALLVDALEQAGN